MKNSISVESWQAYDDHSGVFATIRVNGMLFACRLLEDIRVSVVQNRAGNLSPGARRMKLAAWAFERELGRRTTPEYREATISTYLDPAQT